MSAAFKLAKKKQHDLRRLMQEQKHSRDNGEQKIDSPFAKYGPEGLSCQICKKNVKTALWKVHINSKQHKDNVAHAKMLKEKLEKHAKPATPTIQERVALMKEEKKLKGILKNSSSTTATAQAEEPEPETSNSTPSSGSAIPDDFFDSKVKTPATKQNGTNFTSKPSDEKQLPEEPIPEGFFDDPMKDAKARHIEYKDPVEDEWDKFKKEIKQAEVESLEIITEQQEESTVERQIDEIDAQIKNWNRVLELEKMKERIESKLKTRKNIKTESMDISSGESEEDEPIEILDWRAKKIKKS